MKLFLRKTPATLKGLMGILVSIALVVVMLAMPLPAAKALDAPLSLQAQEVSSNSIYVTWDAVSGAGGYRLYRAESENGNFTQIGDISSPSTEFTDTGLNPGTTYWYYAVAYINSETSSESNKDSATTENIPPLPSPMNLVASGKSTSEIEVSWTAVQNATGYTVYRSLLPNENFVSVANVQAPSAYLLDTGLSPNTTYYYKVEAYNYQTTSDQAGPAYARTLIPLNINLTATATGTSTIRLDWSALTGATSYTVYRSFNQNSGFSVVRQSIGTTYTDTDLSEGTTYYYYVVSNTSITSNTASATTPVQKYYITYNRNWDNSDSTTTSDQTGYSKNASVTLGGLPSGWERIGYIFLGWSTTRDGTAISEPYQMPGNDVTLYARWQQDAPTTHTITYNRNHSDSDTTTTAGGSHSEGASVSLRTAFRMGTRRA